MDPNQTWNRILSAYKFKQWERAIDSAEDLLNWLNKGGFPPEILFGSWMTSTTVEAEPEFLRTVCSDVCQKIVTHAKQELGNVA